MSHPTPEAIDLSVIVLAYNEEAAIGPTLQELRRWLEVQPFNWEIVLVDDGSTDRTLRAARAELQAFTLVRHATNRGMGAGLKSGVQASRGQWVTFLPADGQVPPEAVGILYEARRGVELVLSVYANRDDGVHRKILSAGVRALIVAVHGVRLRSEGPYLFRRALLDPRQLEPDSFFLNFELPIRALAAGIAHRTVVIPCLPRRAGVSKSSTLRTITTVGRELLLLRVRRVRSMTRRQLGIVDPEA